MCTITNRESIFVQLLCIEGIIDYVYRNDSKYNISLLRTTHERNRVNKKIECKGKNI